jgi:hydrogenase maturation protease
MTVKLIGIGNRFRRDDGVGPKLVKMLQDDEVKPTLPDGIQYLSCLCEPASLVDAMRGADIVVFIDAAAPSGLPGQVTRIETGQNLEQYETTTSTHGFGLDEALAIARALGSAPERIVIYAIEGEDFGHGEGLSNAVQAKLPSLIDMVSTELRALNDPSTQIKAIARA